MTELDEAIKSQEREALPCLPAVVEQARMTADLAQRVRTLGDDLALTEKDRAVLLREAVDAIDDYESKIDYAVKAAYANDEAIEDLEEQIASLTAERDDWRDRVFTDGDRIAAAEAERDDSNQRIVELDGRLLLAERVVRAARVEADSVENPRN